METEKKNQELKHLGFLRIAAIQTLVCVLNLYEYAKQNSGPLRSAVETVEGAVTTVVGPVYVKVKGVPDYLLVFLDQKADEATHTFDQYAPPFAKQVVNQAQGLIQKALHKAQELVNETKTGGPRAALHYAAAEYKKFVLTSSMKILVKLNHYPLFHTTAEIIAPTAGCWSGKYNDVVKNMSQKGYAVFGYLPLIPIEEIAKAFKQGEEGKKGDTAARESESNSDSD